MVKFNKILLSMLLIMLIAVFGTSISNAAEICAQCGSTKATDIWSKNGDYHEHYISCTACGYKQVLVSKSRHSDDNQDCVCDMRGCGKKLSHKWQDATCTTPQTCSNSKCNETLGSALGHIDTNKDCKCDRCILELGHSYDTNNPYYKYDNDYHTRMVKCAVCSREQEIYKGNHIDADSNLKCDTCGYTMECSHQSTTGTYKDNGSGHTITIKCTKCEKILRTTTSNHIYSSKYTITAKNHTTTCTTGCGNSKSSEHTDADSNLKCDTCGYTMECSHQGGPVTYTDNGYTGHTLTINCTKCGKTLSTATSNHIYSSKYTTTAKNHTTTCTGCGNIKSSEHTDADSNLKCDTCGYTMACTHSGGTPTYSNGTSNGHTITISCTKCKNILSSNIGAHIWPSAYTKDSTYHSKTCTKCGYGSKAAHVDSNSDLKCDVCAYTLPCTHLGGTPTYSNSTSNVHTITIKCTKCDVVISGVSAAHSYPTTYTTDATYHSKTCEDCGYGIKAKHNDSDTNGYCDACGKQLYCSSHNLHEYYMETSTTTHIKVSKCTNIGCAYNVLGATTSHEWSDYTKDSTFHYRICDLCDYNEKGGHVDSNSNSECDICKYKSSTTQSGISTGSNTQSGISTGSNTQSEISTGPNSQPQKTDNKVEETVTKVAGKIVLTFYNNGKEDTLILEPNKVYNVKEGTKLKLFGDPSKNFKKLQYNWDATSTGLFKTEDADIDGEIIKVPDANTSIRKDGLRTLTVTGVLASESVNKTELIGIFANETAVGPVEYKFMILEEADDTLDEKIPIEPVPEEPNPEESKPVEPNIGEEEQIPDDEEKEPLTGDVVVKLDGIMVEEKSVNKVIGSEMINIVGTPAENFSVIRYSWNDGLLYEATGNEINTIISMENGNSAKLEVYGILSDNTETETKTYEFKISSGGKGGDLAIEPWMEENSDAEGLLVSLRNDALTDKANKNFFKLNEEFIYYVDYKNASEDIDGQVKLVLNLPLNFEVVDAENGEISASKKTITWIFEDGLKAGVSGTKEVFIKYTALSRSSKTYEIVYPQAIIYNGNKKADESAVINYIYKDELTTIKDEHEPYMFGDRDMPTFRPNDTITRAEGAIVLTRIFGIKTNSIKVTKKFSDIDETYAEAQRAITAAANEGIINGYEDGTYKPKNKMTRAEFMTIIAKYIEKLGEDKDVYGLQIKDEEAIKLYNNISGTNKWAIKNVTLLARLNMTSLDIWNTDLRLSDEITRAEVAQLINFYAYRAPAKVEIGTITGFIDVSISHELFGDIIEATRDTHMFTITDDAKELEM